MDTKKAPGKGARQEDGAKLTIFPQTDNTKQEKNIGVNVRPHIFTSGGNALSLDGMHPQLSEYAMATSKDYQAPLDYAIASMGAAVSAAAGSNVTHRGKYVNSPALWIGLVGNSGGGKSPMLKRILAPLADMDERLWQEYDSAHQAWEINKQGKEPREHNLIEYGKSNTFEHLAQSLANNPHGIILYADELGDFLEKMCAYNKSNCATDLIGWWNGDGVPIRRATQKTIMMPRQVHFSMVGTVQPGFIGEQLLTPRMQRIGFASRWLWVNCGRQKGKYQNDEPTDNLFWRTFIERTYHEKRELAFSPDAEQIYAQWYNKVEEQRADENTPIYIQELIAKLEINSIRWMIVRHLLTCDPSPQISAATAEIALQDIAEFRRWGEQIGRMSVPENRQVTKNDLWLMLKKHYPQMNVSAMARALNTANEKSARASIARAIGMRDVT